MFGAISAGKNNMHELALGTTTKNEFYGYAKSALDKSRVAGGSSGGTAGCVATGAVPIGIGTDTAGSLRIPAACNGIIGYRSTINRWPSSDWGIKSSDIRNAIGPLANCMADVELLDEIVTGEKPFKDLKVSDIRIGVARPYFYEDLDPKVREVTE